MTTTPQQILRLATQHFGILGLGTIRGRNRSRSVTRARHVAMYLCRRHCAMSYPEIGKFFGGRDHSTVMSAVGKMRKVMAVGAGSLRRAVLEIEARVVEQAALGR